MIEANISAALLVVGIVIIRKLFGTKLSRNCIYAMWLVVPVRLFLFSDLNIVNPLFRKGPLGNVITGISSARDTVFSAFRRNVTIGHIADKLWLGGVLLFVVYYVVLALRLLWRVKRHSVPAPDNGTDFSVRILKNTDTAFLFGNTIYCSEEIYANKEWMRYVMLHEKEHVNQSDQLWGLLRIMLLCVFWYNPFVWAACFLSKQDCEFACDECVAGKLSKEECRDYCKSLLEIATGRKFVFCDSDIRQGVSDGKLKTRIMYLYNGREKGKKGVFGAVFSIALLACITIGTGEIPGTEPAEPVEEKKFAWNGKEGGEDLTEDRDYFISEYNIKVNQRRRP